MDIIFFILHLFLSKADCDSTLKLLCNHKYNIAGYTYSSPTMNLNHLVPILVALRASSRVTFGKIKTQTRLSLRFEFHLFMNCKLVLP